MFHEDLSVMLTMKCDLSKQLGPIGELSLDPLAVEPYLPAPRTGSRIGASNAPSSNGKFLAIYLKSVT